MVRDPICDLVRVSYFNLEALPLAPHRRHDCFPALPREELDLFVLSLAAALLFSFPAEKSEYKMQSILPYS